MLLNLHILFLIKNTTPLFCSESFSYATYNQSDFCSLKLYCQYLEKSWWSSGMIGEKVTWVRFPARINAVYIKLPPSSDFLKIFIHRYLL